MLLHLSLLSAFICTVIATPIAAPAIPDINSIESSIQSTKRLEAASDQNTKRLQARQSLPINSTELQDGPCKDVFFIFARGTFETGNMGFIVGPQVCADLKSTLGDDVIGCQGVGSPYDAVVWDNLLPGGTSAADIGAATTLFDLAASKCPSSKLVAGGYSQGAAIMSGSIPALPTSIMDTIYGVVLFGDTQNEQDHERIPVYPTSQTKIYCAVGDLLCNGTLIVTLAHLTYGADAPDAANFLVTQLGL